MRAPRPLQPTSLTPRTTQGDHVSDPSPRQLRNFVDGQYVDADSDATSTIVHPSTGQVVAIDPVSSEKDVDTAYTAAARAFETWRDTTPSERQRALLRIADAIEA